ncbi:MAG: DNA-binding response regulator [Leptolyngbya sp. PLA3]|nr:MAG: DNA-binding response regulator [Cyanobacteria bacterium CYA]MCE7969162.1 DNA-binding response regulator [Leptolyngbya sp. PL-A3]
MNGVAKAQVGVIRIMCLDPHELMLAGLGMRFGEEPDMEVASLTNDPEQVIGILARERPGVLVTEIEIEGVNMFGLIARIARHHPETRTVVYTARPRSTCAEAAFAAGAIGFFSKSDPPDQLVAGVRAAPYAESRLLGSTIRAALESSDVAPDGAIGSIARLTRREVEVLCLIGRGMSRVEVAATIRRSPKTVDAHRSSIMSKLGFTDRVQLARFAIREGLVSI